jgi:uncharacterized protein YnzC (UPF0291/DUF896 family)
MPARMPRRLLPPLCLAVLAFAIAACGEADTKQGVDEAAREGLALPLDGIQYNVFITRELNPRITPDKSYVPAGTEADATHTLYGVFIQSCNRSEESHQTTDRFKIVDNQGNEFEPEKLPSDNDFAYRSTDLMPNECIPEAGSVAQLGPTAGSMLLFRLPLANTEYRPLELEIEGTGGQHLTYDLDI